MGLFTNVRKKKRRKSNKPKPIKIAFGFLNNLLSSIKTKVKKGINNLGRKKLTPQEKLDRALARSQEKAFNEIKESLSKTKKFDAKVDKIFRRTEEAVSDGYIGDMFDDSPSKDISSTPTPLLLLEDKRAKRIAGKSKITTTDDVIYLTDNSDKPQNIADIGRKFKDTSNPINKVEEIKVEDASQFRNLTDEETKNWQIMAVLNAKGALSPEQYDEYVRLTNKMNGVQAISKSKDPLKSGIISAMMKSRLATNNENLEYLFTSNGDFRWEDLKNYIVNRQEELKIDIHLMFYKDANEGNFDPEYFKTNFYKILEEYSEKVNGRALSTNTKEVLNRMGFDIETNKHTIDEGMTYEKGQINRFAVDNQGYNEWVKEVTKGIAFGTINRFDPDIQRYSAAKAQGKEYVPARFVKQIG